MAGREEMVVMMFGYGGGWPFWEVALMWAGVILSTMMAVFAFSVVAYAERRLLAWQPQT